MLFLSFFIMFNHSMSKNIKIIAGKHRGTALLAPDGQTTRPTTGRIAENLFNILQHHRFNGQDFLFSQHHILDLCAGSGRLGLESLSRGGLSAVFMDTDNHAHHAIKCNIQKMDMMHKTDILSYNTTQLPNAQTLKDYYKKFSLIFCDAPYDSDIGINSILSAFEKNWLSDNALIILEADKQHEHIEFSFAKNYLTKSYGITNLHFLHKILS